MQCYHGNKCRTWRAFEFYMCFLNLLTQVPYIILNNFKEVDVSISDEVIDCDIQMEDILCLKEAVNLITGIKAHCEVYDLFTCMT